MSRALRYLLYELVDGQVIDAGGDNCGRVDDVEFDDHSPPRPTHVIVGMGGRRRPIVYRAVHAIAGVVFRLTGGRGRLDPVRVPWALVTTCDKEIRLDRRASVLGLDRLDRALARVLGGLPGAT